MIAKEDLEWQLWKDAFTVRSELTPPPKYSESNAFWVTAREKINAAHEKYQGTYLNLLSEHIFFGILMQLEQESKAKEKIDNLAMETANKLRA